MKEHMGITTEIRRQLGARRAEVAHLIRHEMRLRGYNQSSLGRATGIGAMLICRTISGTESNGRVLDALREVGVPEEYLFDPRRALPVRQ